MLAVLKAVTYRGPVLRLLVYGCSYRYRLSGNSRRNSYFEGLFVGFGDRGLLLEGYKIAKSLSSVTTTVSSISMEVKKAAMTVFGYKMGEMVSLMIHVGDRLELWSALAA